MGSMFKGMTIGPKFILSISAVALLVITLGLVRPVPTGRSQNGHHAIAGRSSVISTQIMIGRAYITQNYVAKMKKSKAGADMQVFEGPTGSPGCHPVSPRPR